MVNVPVSGNAPALSDEIVTAAPPAGAGPVRVTVNEACCPDCRVAALMEMPLIVIGPVGGGVTVRLANLTTPPHPASDETAVDELTGPAVTVKLADV